MGHSDAGPEDEGFGIGNYTLLVLGSGAYANGAGGDADRLARALVAELRRHGQHVFAAALLPVLGPPLDLAGQARPAPSGRPAASVVPALPPAVPRALPPGPEPAGTRRRARGEEGGAAPR